MIFFSLKAGSLLVFILLHIFFHHILSGHSWTSYRACVRGRIPKKTCLQRQMTLCKKSSHVITKVLRLTTGSLEDLLKKRDDLKIIHLFRNPLAIINSRTESVGYPVRDYAANAVTLCKKMMIDYDGAKRLKEKYPDRVKLVFYEDIKSNVNEKIKKLYEFIGMEFIQSEVDRLNKVTPNQSRVRSPNIQNTRTKNNAHWWRTHMTYQRYKSTYDKCKHLAKDFNITYFSDRNHLLKLNIPDMTLPKHLII